MNKETLEQRIEELNPYDYYLTSHVRWSEGFKAAISLPEVKALVEAAHDVVGMQLRVYGALNSKTSISQTIYNLDKALADLGEVMK